MRSARDDEVAKSAGETAAGSSVRIGRGEAPERKLKWTVNLWCVVALLSALVPVFFSWAETNEMEDPCPLAENFSTLEIIQGEIHDEDPHFVLISAIAFLVGSLVALVTPLGSILQASGVVTLILGAKDQVDLDGTYCVFYIHLGIGAALGALSALMLVVGMLYPRGIDSKFIATPAHPRFWTFSRGRSE